MKTFWIVAGIVVAVIGLAILIGKKAGANAASDFLSALADFFGSIF